ncbi:MAG: DEAD/DEAH box helicase family protein [Candidatus Enterosoma sp.]|nr:DEAD/DEAH box helicase family protein [Candidatus Enterosoma sp.]
MSLKDLDNALPANLSTGNSDPYKEIVIPCLKESNRFLMGSGFFDSGWIDLAKDGLVEFVKNGGKMVLLTSVKVGEDEFESFQKGEKAKTDKILEDILVKNAIETAKKSGKEWTLNYLAWMVSQDILDVHLLVHKTSAINIYHPKVSFWYDSEENSVCTNGSLNATSNAVNNLEVLSVFCSWRLGEDRHIKSFEDIWRNDWEGKPENYFLIDLPEIVKIDYRRMASDKNPYESLIELIDKYQKNDKKIQARDYQIDAINALKSNDYRGILSMATGTGKTFTSLLATKQIIEGKGNSIVLICVPQTTLIDQWEEAINIVFNAPVIHKCAFNRNDWFSKLACDLRFFDGHDSIFAITTYDSLTDVKFQSVIQRSKGNFIYVFDECHKLGTPKIMRTFTPRKDSYRIGLSATPERWFDEKGTKYIEETIGPCVFEYSLEQAIQSHKLCPYNYHIILSELTPDEMAQFISISDKISKLSKADNSDEESMSDDLKRALEKRAKISKSAQNKWTDFFEIFSNVPDKSGSIVYVFDEQVESMIREIKTRFGLKVHGIVANTKNKDRQAILKSFNEGNVDVLVAIQCLDEGVDIPNCHAEYILASSTNPREFIQRRGRVLRKSDRYPDKAAEIYDFVTRAPDTFLYSNEEKMKVVKRELARVAEFNRLSKNKDDRKMIEYLIDLNGLTEYAKESPWKMKNEDNTEEV